MATEILSEVSRRENERDRVKGKVLVCIISG